MIAFKMFAAAVVLAGFIVTAGHGFAAAHAAMRANAPLQLLTTVPIPDVTAGDFDHFAVDAADNRLYVSAEVRQSIEVFDLSSGAHVGTVGGVATPHTLAFVPDRHALFVADGGDASIKVLAAPGLQPTARIALAGNPDAGLYDPISRIFYIGTTVKGSTTSSIRLVSVDSRREIGSIAVPSDNVESMVVDHTTNRLIVNLRDRKRIGIIDLTQRKLVGMWSVAGLNRNTTLALDAHGRRLFIGDRKPGRLFVIDADRGRTIARLPCVETADDMTYDATARRIYISGAGGLDVFAQDSRDRYRHLARYDTQGGKTSIEVRAQRRLYVVHTKIGSSAAGLQIFAIR